MALAASISDVMGRELASGDSPTISLLDTLVALFGAILIGYVVVRLHLLNPASGDMKGLGWYTGKIAFPLLVFKTVATAELGAVDVGTVAACTVGKCIVFTFTFLITFLAYKGGRSLGQRVLTATVFAFYSIASNDFAVAFPVVQALYGSQDMGVYIAANALVGSLLFVPLTMVLFAIGQNLVHPEDARDPLGVLARGGSSQKVTDVTTPLHRGGESTEEEEETEEEDKGRSCKQRAGVTLLVIWDIVSNPVITFTILGFLYKGIFGFSLKRSASGLDFPSPISNIVTLFTQPFGMIALFLTGTSLRSAKLQLWPMVLVVMKVLVCAYVTGFFGGLLVSSENPNSVILRDFTFFYGAIPSSSAPLIFAQQYDPAAVDLVATAVLFGMVLGGPMMFTTAMFLDPQAMSQDMSGTLRIVQKDATILSLVAGAALVVLLLMLGQTLVYTCPSKRFVLIIGFTQLAKEILALVMSPEVAGPGPCRSYNSSHWSPWGLAASWLQNSARIMIVALFFMSVVFWPREEIVASLHSLRYPPWAIALVMALGCFVLAIVPAVLVDPSTMNEICGADTKSGDAGMTTGRSNSILTDLVWSSLLLLAIVILLFVDILQKRKGDGHGAEDRLGSEEREAPVSPSGPPLSPRSRPCNVVNTHREAADVPEMSEEAQAWLCTLPYMQVKVLVGCLGLKSLFEVVNTSRILAYGDSIVQVGGGFAQMLVLENLIDHSAVAIFLASLLTDDVLAAHIAKILPQLFPILCSTSKVHEAAGAVNVPGAESTADGPALGFSRPAVPPLAHSFEDE